jgi:hypothetical protein
MLPHLFVYLFFTLFAYEVFVFMFFWNMELNLDRGGAISDDVGLDVRTKPKIIRVYSRRNQKGDVAK